MLLYTLLKLAVIRMYVFMYVCLNRLYLCMHRIGFEFVSGVAGGHVRSEAAAHGSATHIREHRTDSAGTGDLLLLIHTYIRQKYEQRWNNEIFTRVYTHTYIQCITYNYSYIHSYIHTYIQVRCLSHIVWFRQHCRE